MLAPDRYGSFEPVGDGCTVFPASASAAEYLVVPQLTAGNPGDRADYRLGGDTINPAVTTSPTAQQLRLLRPAERFHLFLRLGDERRFWGFAPELGPQRAPPPPAPQVGPPLYNELRTFQVCAKLDCSRFDRVGARAKGISAKVAIFVDTLAPAGGVDSAQLVDIARQFDTLLYKIDTTAFGRESDIDANGVVMVLMTNTVNKLVTTQECETGGGFIAGFFFGVDIDPRFSNDSRSNKGEVFYSIVADPAGTLSCAHSVAELQAFVPITFIHEFQHMISFNQHVLVRNGSGELLWLNEGLSHYAEELGGRSYESNGDARVTDCTVGTVACRFYSGNFLNAYDYLDSTGNHYLLPTEGIGTLAERGAAWLFVRYVIDHYSAGMRRTAWDSLTRSMVQTTQVGFGNIEAATGQQFEDLVSRWGLAQYVTDVASAPPELKYVSWNMHSVFSSLHTQRPQQDFFPKIHPVTPTVSAGSAVNLSGTLRAGSPIYHLATQPAGDPGFTLSFTAPNGALINAGMKPRLNVYRLQ